MKKSVFSDTDLYDKSTKVVNLQLQRFLKLETKGVLQELSSYALFEGTPKRIRPFLVFLSSLAVNGKPSVAYSGMTAIELLHCASLVHDDIADQSDFRRGKKTLFKKYGLSSAIVIGDFLFLQAVMILDSLSHELKAKRFLKKLITNISSGQIQDFRLEGKDVNLSEYLEMSYGKTASLCEYACFLGAYLSGATQKECTALSLYGKNLGIAFQIQNDLDNIFSGNGEDFITNKKTYVTIQLAKLNKTIYQLLVEKYKNSKSLSRKDLAECKNLLIRAGVVVSAQDEIRRYVGLAILQLSTLKETAAKRYLKNLPGYLFVLDK